LLSLGTYVFIEAILNLLNRKSAETTWTGIGVTAAAVVFMPLLSRAKRKVGRALSSEAMMTDATQTDFCMYQAGIVLFGLVAHATFGIAWQIASPPWSWCPFCCEPACYPCGERHIAAITHIIRTRPRCANDTLGVNFLLEKCIKMHISNIGAIAHITY
jgi:hypothetical protein